jgi:hypothetical protein
MLAWQKKRRASMEQVTISESRSSKVVLLAKRDEGYETTSIIQAWIHSYGVTLACLTDQEAPVSVELDKEQMEALTKLWSEWNAPRCANCAKSSALAKLLSCEECAIWLCEECMSGHDCSLEHPF